MTVNKINGFAAPYRSLTFRKEKNAIIQRNGLLRIADKISESGSNVIIPPISFVQNGMAVDKSDLTTVPKPPSLIAPYYITVSAQSSINVNDLIFQFVKSPLDLNGEVVILGEYDGTAWRNSKPISTDGLIEESHQEIIDTKKIGPYEGLLTSVSGPNFLTTKGLIYDITGERVLFESDVSFPTVPSDANAALKRVDRVVYRRPLDDKNRIGIRELLVGGTFSSGPQVINQGSLATSLTPNGKSKFVISSDNSIHTIYANGFGGSFSLVYKKLAIDRSTVTASSTVIASLSSDDFDIAISSSNQIYLTYVDNNRLFLTILDSNGNIVVAPVSIESLSNPCSSPKIVLDKNSSRVFIAFEYLESSTLKQVYITTRSLAGSLVKSPQKITTTVISTIDPDILVTSDLIIHLVYNQGGVIYFVKLDDNIVLLSAPAVISTSVASQSFGMLNNNALKPHILVADNMEVFVSFLIKKNATSYGLAIWPEETGKAFCFDMVNSTENVTDYSIDISDHFNDFYISYTSGTSEARFALVKDFMPVLNEQLVPSHLLSIQSKKDKQGSMFHLWTVNSPGTYSNTGVPLTVTGIGTLGVAGSMNSLSLSNTQFYMPFNVNVKKGMNAVLSGSIHGNDGTYLIKTVTPVSLNSVNDYIVVTVTVAFPSSEATSLSLQLQSPDGNSVQFCKSIAEKNDLRALSIDTLRSDILLARISWPGPVILNYIPTTGIGVNSDLFGMYGDIDVDWGATNANTLTMSNGLRIIDLVRNLTYTANGGSFFMNEGDALYVKMDGVNTNITPMVSPIDALPWALPIQVLGFVANGDFNPHLFSVAGMGQLDVGEEIILGQDLDKKIRVRLGITSDSTMAPYSSAVVIAPTDSYPAALSKLDEAFAVMMAEQAVEYSYVTPDDVTTDIVTDLDFSDDNAFFDITVTQNGIKVDQGLSAGYIKISNTTIRFNYALPKNARITIRDERTGVPPVGGGGTDLTNIAVDLQPTNNGFVFVGSGVKGFKGLFLKDTLSNDVYRIEIVNGVVQAVLVV